MKKVLLVGGSGMIGNILLEECLSSPKIQTVIHLCRSILPIQHQKLQQVQMQNFIDLSAYKKQLSNIDIVYFCIGVYTGNVSKQLFKQITVDYPIALAKGIKQHSPQANFVLLSAAGADRTEKSKLLFCKYKGIAENYLFSNLEHVISFRPAYIYPVSKRKEPTLAYSAFRFLYPLIKLLGKDVSIRSTELAQAMFQAGLSACQHQVVENKTITTYLK